MSNAEKMKTLPVAIIGGGPVGLAAAAHLVKQGQSFLLFESGPQVGTSFLDYAHVRLFSPWEFNIDPASKELLLESGWKEPVAKRLPYAGDIYSQYLKPLSELSQMSPFIHVNSEVLAVSRENIDKRHAEGRNETPFVLHVKSQNKVEIFHARAVIDSSGTWQQQNPINSSGIYLPSEKEASHQIFYGIPDVLKKHKDRYMGKKTVVVGSGHSAINTLINLGKIKQEEPSTSIVWVLRKQQVSEVFGSAKDKILARFQLSESIQRLVNEGQIDVYTPFKITGIHQTSESSLEIEGLMDNNRTVISSVDEIISNTGSRPNFDFLREIRYDSDPTIECSPKLTEIIYPKKGIVPAHGEEYLRQPEENFYIIGAKSFGRASTFFLTTGYEQARSVVSSLIGDEVAAKEIHITLPKQWYTEL